MTAIHLLPGDMAAVTTPMQARPQPFMFKAVDLRFDLLAAGDIEQIQFVCRKPVAGQRVRTRPELCAVAAARV